MRSVKRVFSNKPAGGPLPFFTWRSPRHHHFAVHRSEISSHSLSVFAFPFRGSLFGSLFGSPSQGVLLSLPFPLASHTPSVCKAFSNFFLLYDCYQFPFSLLVFTHSKPYCDLPSIIYYLPYISLYFLLYPIPIKTNIGLVFSSFFFLPLSFHTFKTMLWFTKHYSIPTLYSSSLSSLSWWDSFIPSYSLSPSWFPHIQNHVVINQALFNFYPSILSQVSVETVFIPVSLSETIVYLKYPQSQLRQFSILAHRDSSLYPLSPYSYPLFHYIIPGLS